MATELLLDRYEIIETIGRGGSSEIIKAFDRRMERVVAIKAIPAGKKTALRALREARTVALLNHPNIVTLYEFDDTDDCYYLIMEYIEGITLEDFLTGRAPLDVELAVAIAIQVCQALENAHLNDVIHRDIKPANLMLLPDGRVKVMDFGVSRLKGTPVTREGSIMGTFTYMSPEQAGGELVDERSDVWSLAVVLYEMLTGVNPFNADTPAAAVMKILNSEPEPPSRLNPKVSAQLGQVILKALRKYPEDRFDLATDFRYKLERHRRSNRAPKSIVREAMALLVPSEPVNPNTRPVTYLRNRLAELLDEYGQAAARLGVFGALAASAAWFLSNLGGIGLIYVIGAPVLILFFGLVFPQIGMAVFFLCISLALASESIPAAAAAAAAFSAYWYFLVRRLPQAAALPFITPLLSAAGIPFTYPLSIPVITGGAYAPILSALGLLTVAATEILLKTNFLITLTPGGTQPLIRLLSPSVIWQLGTWALVASIGAFLSRRRGIPAQLIGIAASITILTVAYQAAPVYLNLPRPISPTFMQSMTFSFIIIIVMLLIFYHPREVRQDKGAKSDDFSRNRKKVRRSV